MGFELWQAWRSLRRRPAYVLTCAMTLALVFGANAAIFAVVSATLLRPMPFAAEGRVVQLFAQPPGTTCSRWKSRAFASEPVRWHGWRGSTSSNAS